MFGRAKGRLIVAPILCVQILLLGCDQTVCSEPINDSGAGEKTDEATEATPQSAQPEKPKYVQEFPKGGVGQDGADSFDRKAPPKTLLIQGRIEQISDSQSYATFPIILKKLKPKLDTSKPLVAKGAMLAGRTVNTFPAAFCGNWGGILKITQVQINPQCRRNPVQTYLAQNILQPGLPGHVNFIFAGTKVVLLKPSSVVFMVPASVAMNDQLLSKVPASQEQIEAMRELIGNFVIPAPFSLNLGAIRTNATGPATTFGERYKVTILSNQIRSYAPNILEEQCVSRSIGTDPKTMRPTVDYNETVARFTLTDPDHMYVQAANIGYGSKSEFCNKVMVAGYITRGRIMPNTASKGARDVAKLRRLQMKLRQLPGVDANMVDRIINQILNQQ